MALKVSANGLSVVFKKSKGIAMATLPNICKTPFPAPPGPLPLPYPSIGKAESLKNGSILTKIENEPIAIFGSCFGETSGDEPGSLGGIVSGCNKGEASFISFSGDVIVEQRGVCRKTDQMLMNKVNTVCMAGVMQDDVPDPNEPETDETYLRLIYEYSDKTVIAGAEVEIEFADGSKETHTMDDNGELFIKNLPASKRGKFIARLKHDPWDKYFENQDKDYYRRFRMRKPSRNPDEGELL